jgi:hypothetical protein
MTVLEAKLPLKTGFAMSPRGDMAIATVAGSSWGVQIGRIPESAVVLSGEHPVEIEIAHPVPCAEKTGRLRDFGWIPAGAVAAAALVAGIIIGGIAF